MSSTASSSGIESDTDSSPSLPEEKDNLAKSDTNKITDESTNTLIHDNEDEGFINLDFADKETKLMPDTNTPPHREHSIFTTPKSIPCHYPYSSRNPYDDDTSDSGVVEDWDEECKLIEPYHFPSYIRRAQWPHHWRWTPPLGIRRSCTQQLHRNLGFEPTGLYDDMDSFSSCFL